MDALRMVQFILLLLIRNLAVFGKNYCKCVPSNFCDDITENADGAGLLDIRQHHGDCSNHFEICCENIKQIVTNACGYQNIIEYSSRITSNSENAQFGEYPWTVLILLRDLEKERNMYRCGGSLINPQVILTAAHCVLNLNPNHLTARAGEWNTRSREEPLPHQDMLVEEILVHPNFNEGSLQNDLALLFLIEPYDLSDNLGIVCLSPNLATEDTTCVASGWGKDTFKKGRHSSVLKKVELPIVSRENCQASLRQTRLGNFFSLHQSFICAGGEKNKDTCKGDGGSPLVCRIPGQNNRFFQVGIVSWGIGCGEQTPGVYTNVPLYVDWIETTFKIKNIDANTFKY